MYHRWTIIIGFFAGVIAKLVHAGRTIILAASPDDYPRRPRRRAGHMGGFQEIGWYPGRRGRRLPWGRFVAVPVGGP